MQLHPKRISENEIKRKNIFMEKSINCTQKKYMRMKLKEKNTFMEKSIVKYEKINSEFMLVFYLIAGLHKGCSNDQWG